MESLGALVKLISARRDIKWKLSRVTGVATPPMGLDQVILKLKIIILL